MIHRARGNALALLIAIGAAPAASRADNRFIMVPDRFDQHILLFSAADGTLVNANFLPFVQAGRYMPYPVEPIQVGAEIWISDVLAGLHRFSVDDNLYLGEIGDGVLDYTLGFEVVNGIAYVPIDAGPQAGTVVMLDVSSNVVGSFPVGGWITDVLRRGNELLIFRSGQPGVSILRYDFSGNLLGSFICAGCPVPATARQLALHPDGGVLAAGDLTAPYDGAIYRYSASGQFVATYSALGNLFGIHMLDDGRVMCSTRKGDGRAFAYDFVTQSSTVFASGLDSFGMGVLVLPSACYANCDRSVQSPLLNVLDFTCFLNRFAAADSYANCDGSTQPPILNVLDFSCFLNRFAAGCP